MDVVPSRGKCLQPTEGSCPQSFFITVTTLIDFLWSGHSKQLIPLN